MRGNILSVQEDLARDNVKARHRSILGDDRSTSRQTPASGSKPAAPFGHECDRFSADAWGDG
jgi:hypothetical protein